MDPNKFKAQVQALAARIGATQDPEAEMDRLLQFVGNRNHEALAQQAGALKQQADQAMAANKKMARGARTSSYLIKGLATATIALGAYSVYETYRGPVVTTLDSGATVDLIPASTSDAQMLSDVFRTNAQYFAPMAVVTPAGAVVHPEIPSTAPSAVIAKDSCVYAFGSRVLASDGRQYAQVVMRANGVTSKGYIAAERLQPAIVDRFADQPCKATILPPPKL